MTKSILPTGPTSLLSLVACLALAACGQRATASPPAAAAALQGNGSIVVVVLADHYTTGQQTIFNQTVTNLFQYGLLVDPDYDDHAGAFNVIPVFEPWDPSSPSPSNYGFTVGGSGTNCSVSWVENAPPGSNTSELLEAAAGPYNPTHIVVVGNNSFDFGCTLNKEWSYVAAGAVGKGVLPHEFGHLLAELFDEYSLPAYGQQPPSVDCRNCSTAQPPYWGAPGPSGIVNQPPCDYYGAGIVHPYENCKMASSRQLFCPICRDIVKNAIAFYDDPDKWNPNLGLCPIASDPGNASLPTAPRNMRISLAGLLVQPPSQQSIVRVLVSLDRRTNTATPRKVTDAKGRFVAPDRRLGTLAYEVMDGSTTLSVGVVQGDPFEVRDYRGGGQHTVGQADTASVVVLIPNETSKDLARTGRSVQINFYRLTPGVTAPRITRQVLQELKGKKQVLLWSAISADQLRNVM